MESAVVRKAKGSEEELFVGTAESEHIEMYLKAIWCIREKRQDVKVSSIARLLGVKQPSVVQMLRKLNSAGLVHYDRGSVKMTADGNHIGRQMRDGVRD